MRRALQRERNAGLAQLIRDGLHGDSSCDPQRGCGGAQIVDPRRPDPGLRQQPAILPLDDSLLERHSGSGHEEESLTATYAETFWRGTCLTNRLYLASHKYCAVERMSKRVLFQPLCSVGQYPQTQNRPCSRLSIGACQFLLKRKWRP